MAKRSPMVKLSRVQYVGLCHRLLMAEYGISLELADRILHALGVAKVEECGLGWRNRYSASPSDAGCARLVEVGAFVVFSEAPAEYGCHVLYRVSDRALSVLGLEGNDA